jgi:ribonucleoside-triphosphate reductase
MREFCDKKSAETGLNFTLLATPAEGLSGRFVKIDREKYGKIEGVTDRAYYTNSFHVPVYYPIGAFEKLDIEAPYHDLTNAGHISYVELDGDTAKNPEAFEAVIRHMQKVGIGYGSVNHPVDRDPVCGYTGVIDDVCPRCGRREGEPVTIERLNELRMKFPSVPVPCDCIH